MSISIKPASDAGPMSRQPPSASRIADRMMKEIDTDNNGSISKQDYIDAMKKHGVSEAYASKQFDAIDTRKSDSIGKSDIEAAIKNGTLKGPPGGRPGVPPPSAGGPPPGGGAGGGPSDGAKGAGGTGSNSLSQQFDPADTNHDGKISEQERIAYTLTQAQVTTRASSDNLGENVDETV